MEMLKAAFVALVILIVLVLIVVAVGYALPVGHVASSQATLGQTPDAVFATLSDVAHFPDWRADVSRVDVLSSHPLRWREHGKNGDITFVIVESVRPLHLLTKIDDASLPFGGSWSYDLVPNGSGTTVTITERGEVYNPVFRFMSRFVFGHTATMEGFLAALAKRSSG
jgi:hypothetical protein